MVAIVDTPNESENQVRVGDLHAPVGHHQLHREREEQQPRLPPVELAVRQHHDGEQRLSRGEEDLVLLLDVETHQGVTGHAYVFAYTPTVLANGRR